MESICGSIERTHPPPLLQAPATRPPTPPPYRILRGAVPTHPTHTTSGTQTSPPGQRNRTQLLGRERDLHALDLANSAKGAFSTETY
jgi:hypothetical protein